MIEVKGDNGTVAFGGHVVTIVRKGFKARSTVGKGTKTIPVTSITAVQFKAANLGRGFIQFTVPGGIERRSQRGRQTKDAQHDENSVLFWRQQQPGFEELRDAVEAAISGPTASTWTETSSPHIPPPQTTASVTDQLERLAQLWRDGALTAEQFEQAKGRLLSS